MSDLEYQDERWCDNCKEYTLQECYDSGHERDGSMDRQECLMCGWHYSGLTGEWEPPYV